MTEPGDRLEGRMPLCDESDPASLEAFYGNFGYAEAWRKCVIANCKEIVRARYTLANEKISESRIDDLAHVHDLYLDFLTTHLKGRRIREENVLQSMATR